MKFQCNTKPFCEALNLGIINSNVSNFHKKSCIVQLTASENLLRINVESDMIKTEMTLQGHGDGEEASIFVDSLLIKQLVNTFDSPVVTLEYTEGGLILESGKSKFTLAKMVDVSELELSAPTYPEYNKGTPIDKSGWKFVKDSQMYAISLAFVHPVYTYVWVGDTGDVIVGDFDSSLFTHSSKINIGRTCLLSDTIINLFNALPDNSMLYPLGDDYVVMFQSDSFTYITQFTPLYESNESVGSYNSDIFLDTMEHPKEFSEVKTGPIIKLMSQASLLASESEDTMTIKVSGNMMYLKGRSVDGVVDIGGDASLEYEEEFNLESLRSVISNYTSDIICISPLVRDDEVAGILVWDDDLTTLIAGVE